MLGRLATTGHCDHTRCSSGCQAVSGEEEVPSYDITGGHTRRSSLVSTVSQEKRRCPAMPSSPEASRCPRQGGAQLCPPHGDTGEAVQYHVLLSWCLKVSQEEVSSYVLLPWCLTVSQRRRCPAMSLVLVGHTHTDPPLLMARDVSGHTHTDTLGCSSSQCLDKEMPS